MAPLWQAVVTLVIIVGMFVVLALERLPSDFVMLFSLILFLPLGILTPKEVGAGFGNDSMLTVMSLLIVTSALVSTGGLELVKRLVYTLVKGTDRRSLHLVNAVVLTFVGLLSAFIANTPLVAMFIPFMQDAAARFRVAPSKLLLPLSYAAILGGTCSLIGTTTNLVALGLAQKAIPGFTMDLLSMARIGLPVLFAGLLYIMVCGPFILPNRGGVSESVRHPREYLVTFAVQPRSAVGGRTIEAAGLRSLPGLYLSHISRGGVLMVAPEPATVLIVGDHLTFAGDIDAVVGLTRMRGLRMLEDEEHADLKGVPGSKVLVEAVVAPGSELVDKSVRDLRFRSKFNAAIIAVHRNGERIDHERIGDIVLRTGDTLLLVTRAGFLDVNRNSTAFALVRAVDDFTVIRHSRAPLSILAMVAIVVVSASTEVPLFTCAAFAAAFLMLTRCMTASTAHTHVHIRIHRWVHRWMGVHTLWHTHMGAHALAHTHTHTHTHVHTDRRWRGVTQRRRATRSSSTCTS
jgi:di/tricarboxylate transporter